MLRRRRPSPTTEGPRQKTPTRFEATRGRPVLLVGGWGTGTSVFGGGKHSAASSRWGLS
jgi:hypothetical protein